MMPVAKLDIPHRTFLNVAMLGSTGTSYPMRKGELVFGCRTTVRVRNKAKEEGLDDIDHLEIRNYN